MEVSEISIPVTSKIVFFYLVLDEVSFFMQSHEWFLLTFKASMGFFIVFLSSVLRMTISELDSYLGIALAWEVVF